MLKIGIVGGNEIIGASNLLKDIFFKRGFITKSMGYSTCNADGLKNEFGEEISDFAQSKSMDIIIQNINYNDFDGKQNLKNDFDLLIINSLDNVKTVDIEAMENNIERDRIILLNSDEKNIFTALKNNMGSAKVITYGLNSKACVTASSISDSTVQCCIQRSLPTFAGNSLEQQEFTMKVDTSLLDISSILAAATAAIIKDSDTDFSID